MKYRDDIDHIVIEKIDRDVWKAGYNQFKCIQHGANASGIWKQFQTLRRAPNAPHN